MLPKGFVSIDQSARIYAMPKDRASNEDLVVQDPAAVREQLNRVLAHPLLRNSNRSCSFLQFVVEEALHGRAPQLKERTVGVAVFERDAEYDTNLDHVVRTAASDLRRRLAMYYQEPGRHNELVIALPQGGYAPTFRPPSEIVSEGSALPELDLRQNAPAAVQPAASRRKTALYLGAALLALVAIALVAAQMRPPASAIDSFWGPFMDSSDPVLLSVGAFFVPEPVLKAADANPSEFTRYVQSAMPVLVALGDADALSRISGVLTARGRKFRVRGQSSSSFSDLREGPAVLVGAFNNAWSVRLTNQLRYSLFRDPDRKILQIRDRRDPGQDLWKADVAWAADPGSGQAKEDFALISRVWDPTTGHPVLIVGGLTMLGTVAAGEFVSNPAYLTEFAASAPKGWEHKNLQVVIKTQLIGGDGGPPKVQAVELW